MTRQQFDEKVTDLRAIHLELEAMPAHQHVGFYTTPENVGAFAAVLALGERADFWKEISSSALSAEWSIRNAHLRKECKHLLAELRTPKQEVRWFSLYASADYFDALRRFANGWVLTDEEFDETVLPTSLSGARLVIALNTVTEWYCAHYEEREAYAVLLKRYTPLLEEIIDAMPSFGVERISLTDTE